MSGSKTSLDLSERIKLGIPSNDLEAIAMLYEAGGHFGIDVCVGTGVLAYIGSRRIQDNVWHSYECALRAMRYDFGQKFPRAVAEGGSARLDAYIRFVEQGGDF